MSQGTRGLLTPLELSLIDRLRPEGVEVKALFSFKEHFVLVAKSVDKKSANERNERKKKVVEIICTCADEHETDIQSMLCDTGTGCVDLKTIESTDSIVGDTKIMRQASTIVDITEIMRQAESCLEVLEGVTVTGVFLIDGKLVLVVDDGGQAENLDTQVIAKINACPTLNTAPLRVVRCSQGTGCVDLRAQ